MWGKIVAGAAALLVFALAAFLGRQLIISYGDALHSAGQSEAAAAQLPAILAAREAVANAELAARDRVIAAENKRASEAARLLPLIISANEKVDAYAQTASGRALCLAADRVRAIEDDRAALFPDPAEAASGIARSVPTDPLSDGIRSQPE